MIARILKEKLDNKAILDVSFSEIVEQCGYLYDDNEDLMDMAEKALKKVDKADIRKMEEQVKGMKGALDQILEYLGDAKKAL